jgi:hypothetical protein
VTRSLAAVPSIQEVEEACARYLLLFREVHSFAYDAGGQSNIRRSQNNDPTGDVAVAGLAGGPAVDVMLGAKSEEARRMGARENLAIMAMHLDMAVTAGLAAIRMEQRSGDVAKSQTWSVKAAEDVSSEYEARKRRGHARSVGG